MNQITKTNSEVVKCLFCSEPIRIGWSWWDDKEISSLRKHELSPCMEEVLTHEGVKMAYVMHKCKGRESDASD